MSKKEWEFSLGNVLVTGDETSELIGWKLKVDIIANPIKYYEPEKVGELTAYLLDDRLENLFIAADAHSDRLCHILEDVKVITEPKKRKELILSEQTKYVGKGNYLDGDSHKVIGVCGRVVILDDLTFDKPNIFTSDDFKKILRDVAVELYNLLIVDFIMVKDDLYMPSNEEFPNEGMLSEENRIQNGEYFHNVVTKETEKVLRSVGFKKTGMDSFVIKPNMILVNQ